MSSSASEPVSPKKALGDPEVRRFLEDFVRRRAPASDVEDLVQTVLVDALAADRVPGDREELRKWLVGIARHKVADFHRKTTRERPTDPPEQEAQPAPIEAREMVHWAEKQAASSREGAQTLGWMAREGEGEKLESIAADEQVPAARVRQRVSRMRRWMKERWAAELAAVAIIAVLVIVAWRFLRGPKEAPEARPDIPPPPTVEPRELTPFDKARQLRAEALERCDRSDWRGCLDGLDEAKQLDPAGDAEAPVQQAREKAAAALEQENAPPPPIEKSAPAPKSKELAPTKPGPTKPSPTKSDVDLKKEEYLKQLDGKKSAPAPAPTGTFTPATPSQQQTPPTTSTAPQKAPAKTKAPAPMDKKGGSKSSSFEGSTTFGTGSIGTK